jgi:glycosyltransferase 2 family protein
MSRRWHLVISLVLTALIGVVLYRSVPDWRQAWLVMLSARPLWLLAGLCFVSLHMVVRAWRWGVLLTPVKKGIAFRSLFSLTLVKYVINVVPPRLGEVAASVLLAKKEKVSSASVIAASLFERVLDTLAVLVLFAFYLVFLAERYMPSTEQGREVFEKIRYATVVGLGLMVLAAVLLMLILKSRRWHDRVPRIIARHLFSFLDGLRAMQSRSAVAKTIALSFLIWLAISMQLWCLIRAYLQVFPFPGTFLIVAVTVVGVAIPTPGGVGGFQFFMNLSLIHFFRPYLTAVDADSQAAGISNGAYLVSMVPVILVGLVALQRHRADDVEPSSVQ